MNSNLSFIGTNIRRFRKNRKWTQEELAKRADISRIALIHIESGKAVPTLDTLSALAKVFEISIVTVLSPPHDPLPTALNSTQVELGNAPLAPTSTHTPEAELQLFLEVLRGCSLHQLVAVRKIVLSLLSAFNSR